MVVSDPINVQTPCSPFETRQCALRFLLNARIDVDAVEYESKKKSQEVQLLSEIQDWANQQFAFTELTKREKDRNK